MSNFFISGKPLIVPKNPIENPQIPQNAFSQLKTSENVKSTL